MVSFTTNQRRSVRWTDTNQWQEEVLAASGVEASQTNFEVISGSNVQEVLEIVDNVLEGLEVSLASGVLVIDELVNVSGVTADIVGDLEVVTLPSGEDSVFKFSCTVPAQPTNPVSLRLVTVPRGAAASGNLGLNFDYNIFEDGDDLTPGAFSYSGSINSSISASDYEKYRIVNYSIPTNEFSSGSAPFLLSMRITRDVSVASNYGHDVSIAGLYLDNIPGGVTGNTAGYVGGNLIVTGDLTVEGLTVLQGGTIPASGNDTGVSGSIVIDDNFLYVAPSTNTWKRTPINSF